MPGDLDREPIEPGLLAATSQLSEKWKLLNVVLLGMAFMLIFTAFQTGSMMEVSWSY